VARAGWTRAFDTICGVIAFVEGRVVVIAADSAIVQAGGVGYRIFCGPGTLALLKEGTDSRLYTHHLVREDAQALYGFRTTEELGFFELLTTVTGVGPKVALAIVSSRPVAELQLAILQGDEGVLTAVSGVGKKLAARVVLELKEKVSAAGAIGAGGTSPGSSESEVTAALQALGYTASEAREAARGAVAALPVGASLEDRVKAALRVLRRD
jgi:Holliday junction DNA helicase RuvA